MSSWRLIWLVATLAALYVAPVCAQSSVRADALREVFSEMHRVNQKEVQLGQLAQEKGSTMQVRVLGESLIRDHANVNQAVIQLARRSGSRWKPPVIAPPVELRMLRPLSGADFDAAFARTLIRSYRYHKSVLLSVQQAPVPSEIRAIAENLMPRLEKNLESAIVVVSRN